MRISSPGRERDGSWEKWQLKLLHSFITLVLQSEDFQPREGWERFLVNDGPLKLLQSFSIRVLQNEDFQPREGGGRFLGNDGRNCFNPLLQMYYRMRISSPGRVGVGSWEIMGR